MIDLFEEFDGSSAAKRHLMEGIDAHVASVNASRQRGDVSLVGRVEDEVRAAPRRRIRFDDRGDATIGWATDQVSHFLHRTSSSSSTAGTSANSFHRTNCAATPKRTAATSSDSRAACPPSSTATDPGPIGFRGITPGSGTHDLLTSRVSVRRPVDRAGIAASLPSLSCWLSSTTSPLRSIAILFRNNAVRS